MPLLTAKCSIVSNTMGGAGGNYWITAIGSSGTEYDAILSRTAILSDDSIVYSNRCGGSYLFSVGKLTASGELDWSRQYSNMYGTSHNTNTQAHMYVDSSDNTWIAYHYPDTLNYPRPNIVGFTSTGSKISGDRTYYTPSVSCYASNVISGTGSGNARFAFVEGSSPNDIYLINHGASSGIVSGYRLDTGIYDINPQIALVEGTLVNPGDTELILYRCSNVVLISKKNPFSTSLQFTKQLKGESGASTSMYPSSCVVDSSQNYYFGYTDAGLGASYLSKFSDTGTTISVDWTAKIHSGSPSGRVTPAVDSNGNSYLVAYIDGDALLCKFNSSGTLQWQRRFSLTYSSGTGTNVIVQSMQVDSNDNPIISFYAINPLYSSAPLTSQTATWVAKLPPDGSGTGTYNFSGSVVADYTVSSDTITSTTAVVSAQPFNVNVYTTSITSYAHSSTDSAISLLEEKVDVV